MADFFTSILFKYFVVPLVTVFLSIFVKTASRNDRYATFCKEDLAVGLEIALISTITFIAYSVSVAHRLVMDKNMPQESLMGLKDKFISGPWLIASFILGLWGISTLVRKMGWKNKNELNWPFGIIIPFLYGIITLLVVVSWIGS